MQQIVYFILESFYWGKHLGGGESFKLDVLTGGHARVRIHASPVILHCDSKLFGGGGRAGCRI